MLYAYIGLISNSYRFVRKRGEAVEVYVVLSFSAPRSCSPPIPANALRVLIF